jgi:hypothetical protein
MLKELRDQFAARQDNPYLQKYHAELAERLERKIANDWKEYLEQNIETAAHGDVVVLITDKACATFHNTQYTDGETYGGSYKNYRIKKYNHVFNMPYNMRVRDIERTEFDGLLNIECKKIRQIEGVTVYNAVWLEKGRGYNYKIKAGFVAELGELTYHADTLKKAVTGVYKKHRRYYKKNNIHADEMLTARRYHRMTGACYAGIRQWCSEHGIDPDSKMPVLDVIKMMEQSGRKPYGFDKLKSSIVK